MQHPVVGPVDPKLGLVRLDIGVLECVSIRVGVVGHAVEHPLGVRLCLLQAERAVLQTLLRVELHGRDAGELPEQLRGQVALAAKLVLRVDDLWSDAPDDAACEAARLDLTTRYVDGYEVRDHGVHDMHEHLRALRAEAVLRVVDLGPGRSLATPDCDVEQRLGEHGLRQERSEELGQRSKHHAGQRLARVLALGGSIVRLVDRPVSEARQHVVGVRGAEVDVLDLAVFGAAHRNEDRTLLPRCGEGSLVRVHLFAGNARHLIGHLGHRHRHDRCREPKAEEALPTARLDGRDVRCHIVQSLLHDVKAGPEHLGREGDEVTDRELAAKPDEF